MKWWATFLEIALDPLRTKGQVYKSEQLRVPAAFILKPLDILKPKLIEKFALLSKALEGKVVKFQLFPSTFLELFEIAIF